MEARGSGAKAGSYGKEMGLAGLGSVGVDEGEDESDGNDFCQLLLESTEHGCTGPEGEPWQGA